MEKESGTPLQVSTEEILDKPRMEQQTKLEAEKLKVQAPKTCGLSIPQADTLNERSVFRSRNSALLASWELLLKLK